MTTKMTACQFLKDHEWTQGTYAKDKHGKDCGVENGYSFCAHGVLHKVYGWSNNSFNRGYIEVEAKVLDHLSEKYIGGLTHYNDLNTTTKQDIVDLFCEAGV